MAHNAHEDEQATEQGVEGLRSPAMGHLRANAPKYPKTQSAVCPDCEKTITVRGHTHSWRVSTAAMLEKCGCGPCSSKRKRR